MIRSVILTALAVFLAAPALAQGGPLEPMISNWRDCVVRSYRVQRTATPDLSMAAEAAFLACRSEEDALFVGQPLSPQSVAQFRILYRAKMKGILLAG